MSHPVAARLIGRSHIWSGDARDVGGTNDSRVRGCEYYACVGFWTCTVHWGARRVKAVFACVGVGVGARARAAGRFVYGTCWGRPPCQNNVQDALATAISD